MDRVEAIPIPHTRGAHLPFFSPDGEWLGFVLGNTIRTVPLAGGPAITVCSITTNVSGASWGSNDIIVFATPAGLWQVPAGGGEPRILALADTARSELYRWPEVLPGGRAAVFTRVDAAGFHLAAVWLETAAVRPLGLEGTNPHFVTPGYLAFARLDGALLAAAFDPNAVRITGPALPVTEGVLVGIAGAAKLGVSRTGALAYFQESSADRALAVVDRAGLMELLPVPPQAFTSVSFSPDGRRIATDASASGGDLRDIWVLDLAETAFRRLTFDSGSRSPVSSPDGRRIAFGAKPGGRPFGHAIRWTLAEGGDSAETLLAGELDQFPGAFMPDGRALVFHRRDLATGRDLWILPLAGDRKPQPYLRTPFDERGAAVSPDGRWLAYVSNESGRDEVYVRGFPKPGPAVLVSFGGGREPRWAPSGRELFYRTEHGMVAAAVDPSSSFRVGRRLLLFNDDPYLSSGDRAAAQFASLRWIEGTWRGRLPDGGGFYERYRFVDDSTLAMQAFTDSTLTSTTDSAHIALRDGTVADEGGAARWAATRLDSTGVAFTPIEGATNAFTWTRERGDRWTATLTWTDKEGQVHVVTYPMERIGP